MGVDVMGGEAVGAGAGGSALDGVVRLATGSVAGRLRLMAGRAAALPAEMGSGDVSAARTGAGGATGHDCAQAFAGPHKGAAARMRLKGKRDVTAVLYAFHSRLKRDTPIDLP